jgi:hypothetical protein
MRQADGCDHDGREEVGINRRTTMPTSTTSRLVVRRWEDRRPPASGWCEEGIGGGESISPFTQVSSTCCRCGSVGRPVVSRRHRHCPVVARSVCVVMCVLLHLCDVHRFVLRTVSRHRARVIGAHRLRCVDTGRARWTRPTTERPRCGGRRESDVSVHRRRRTTRRWGAR